MDARLTFDVLSEGQLWISPARTITETDVVSFATLTGDMNPLHVDREFASQSPYRQPIAHGLLGLSWVAGLGSNYPLVDTVAFVAVRNWEFLRPLFFGDTVHVRTTVAEKQSGSRRTGRVLWKLELINQHGEVTQQGNFETLVRVASGKKDRLHHKPHIKPTAAPANRETSGSGVAPEYPGDSS